MAGTRAGMNASRMDELRQNRGPGKPRYEIVVLFEFRSGAAWRNLGVEGLEEIFGCRSRGS